MNLIQLTVESGQHEKAKTGNTPCAIIYHQWNFIISPKPSTEPKTCNFLG